jgi:hypothetical protein
MTRHQIATSSIGLIAASLLPALAAVSTATVIVMQRSSMADKTEGLDEPRLPDFPATIAQLQKSRETLCQVIDLLKKQEAGAIELADFANDINKLGDADLIWLDSPLLATLEQHGHVAAYEQLLRDVDLVADYTTELSTFSTEDANFIGKLGQIGSHIQNTSQSFWAISAVNAESWMRQHRRSTIFSPNNIDSHRHATA